MQQCILFFILVSACVSVKSEFLKGVNYGNRFIPEDWMSSDNQSIFGDHYGPVVEKPANVARVSLCDVTDDRILQWLDDKIQEEDFQKMQEYGVQLLRVPTGYWNWVDLGDSTPSCPDNVAVRYRNLQSVKTHQYDPFLEKIYQYAAQYGIKVFMELHGAPGSQNGEIHSGCVTGPENSGIVSKPTHYFYTEWNKKIAVDAIGKMSEKCKQHESVCWGVGVLNEAQPSLPSPTASELHVFLQDYYAQAIQKSREYLSWDMPVVLYDWTYNFFRWPDNAFPYDQYGLVIWDTHIYRLGSSTVDDVLTSYIWELNYIEAFQDKQAADIIVGEFALSNVNLTEDQQEEWQDYADRVYPRIQEKASGGALLWNWDCQFASWSMRGLAEVMHVQWHL